VGDTSHRVRGLLLGLCVADRNEGPIRMALELAASLETHGAFNRRATLRKYVRWFQREGIDTGPVSARVFGLMAEGIAPTAARVSADREFGGLTAGCNPAHRATPLAMCHFLEDGRLPDLAKREALLTHHHPLAGDAAAAVVVLCRALIRGQSWASSLSLASVNRDPRTQAALACESSESLTRGGFAPEALHAAIFFVAKNESFEGALSESLQFAGPANYCPPLVGAIAGSRWGSAQIPLERCGRVEILARALLVSEALSSAWRRVD